jgi:hypothetical protein
MITAAALVYPSFSNGAAPRSSAAETGPDRIPMSSQHTNPSVALSPQPSGSGTASPAGPSPSAATSGGPGTSAAPNATITATVPSTPTPTSSTSTAVPSGFVNGTIPIYHISPANQGWLKGIHVCQVLGNDGVNQAVECASLYAFPNNSANPTGVDVYANASGMCQNLANHDLYPQCNRVNINFSLSGAAFSSSVVDTLACGPGACVVNARNSAFGTKSADIGLTGCDPATNTAYEFWGVDWSDSTITLPNNTTPKQNSSSLSSGHVIVCAG